MITTCEDACKRPPFPLPMELRLKIYEQLLVLPDGSLKANGIRHYERQLYDREKDKTFISILLTCRTVYEEALPILYGKNVLAFHDNDLGKPLLPFPEDHLVLIKHVEVEMSPCIFGSVKRMGNLLMTLGTSRAKFIDISVRIYMPKDKETFRRRYLVILQPSEKQDALLFNDNPIVVGLLSLKAVKRLDIRIEGDVRFQPGGACALRTSFMEKGITIGRSIAIRKPCRSINHEIFEMEEPCSTCGPMNEGRAFRTGYYEYHDDEVTWRLLKQFNEYTEHKRRKAVEKTRRRNRSEEILEWQELGYGEDQSEVCKDFPQERSSIEGPLIDLDNSGSLIYDFFH